MKKTRLSLLDGGTLALPDYKLFWGRGTGEIIRFACYSVLVDHEDGLFLFDTGFDWPFMEKWTPQDNPLQAALSFPSLGSVPKMSGTSSIRIST
jgi:4-pyridoxolactonase